METPIRGFGRRIKFREITGQYDDLKTLRACLDQDGVPTVFAEINCMEDKWKLIIAERI